MVEGPGLPETYPDRMTPQLMAQLSAQAHPGSWWQQSISSMTEMIIQQLARDRPDHNRIAAFIDCPRECVDMIARHYGSTIQRIHGQYERLHRRRYID